VNLSSPESAALEAGSIRLGLFVRLAVTPILRCWLGIGNIAPGINAVDATSEVYHGFGQLLTIPPLAQLINGAADRIELSLSGVDDQILNLATFANVVHGASCYFGFGMFDAAWTLLGPVHWARRYTADYLRMQVAPANPPEEQTAEPETPALVSQTNARRRARLSYFTQQDQQARALALNPSLTTDLFCQWTPKYSVAGQKTWPKFA
jgi:hypothetical protein